MNITPVSPLHCPSEHTCASSFHWNCVRYLPRYFPRLKHGGLAKESQTEVIFWNSKDQ